MNLPDVAPSPTDPVLVSGDVEADVRGFAYGAMLFEVYPGCSTERHSHASEETWLIREGGGRARIGDQQIDLVAGNRFTIPPRVSHTITNTSEENLKVIAFWWRESEDGQ